MTMVTCPSVYWSEGVGQDGNFGAPMEAKNENLLENDAFRSVCDPQCNDAANRRLIEYHAQVRRPQNLSMMVALGLELQITPTLVNWIQEEMNKKYHQHHTASGARPTNLDQLGLSSPIKVSDLGPNEKLKAACFNASTIKIGSWERKSVYENDLVAKIYFAKRKVVWELLQNSRKKSKIEMQWSDIIGIRVTMEEDQPEVLEVELGNPPSFFDEQEPQPRKHTMWQQASDFTGGQASVCRRHLVTFPPGTLEKHIPKLFLAEQRLHELSRQGFPTMPSPHFDMLSYGPTNFLFPGFNGGYQHFGLPYLPNVTTPIMAVHPSFQEINSPLSDQYFLHDKKVYENPLFVPGSRSYADGLSGGQVHGIVSNVASSSSTMEPPAMYYHPQAQGGHSWGTQGGNYDRRKLKEVEEHLQNDFENVTYGVKYSPERFGSWNPMLNLARDGTRGSENLTPYEHDSSSTVDDTASGNENVPMTLDSQFYQTVPGMPPSFPQVQPMMHQNWGNLGYDPNGRAATDYSPFGGDGDHLLRK